MIDAAVRENPEAAYDYADLFSGWPKRQQRKQLSRSPAGAGHPRSLRRPVRAHIQATPRPGDPASSDPASATPETRRKAANAALEDQSRSADRRRQAACLGGPWSGVCVRRVQWRWCAVGWQVMFQPSGG